MQEAGEFGENHLLTILSENKLPDNTFILHNVTLQSIINVQIDILLISPSWCLILEVKNLTGELTFTTKPPQLICEKEEQRFVYRSPESQINQYIFGLKAFLEKHHYQLPIFGAIALPFSNAIIKTPPQNTPLIIGREIINYIWSLPKNEKINPKQLGKLIIKQSKGNLWNQFPLTKYYGIDPISITPGVECPNCGTIPMKRILRTWLCETCQKRDMHAHQQALTYLRKKSPTSKREGACAPVKVGDEFW